jgi:hypothetical protein
MQCDDWTMADDPEKIIHTEEEIGRAFGHLHYELQTFLREGVDLLSGTAGPRGNEVLEAFLIHARVIATFLGANRFEKDDVTPMAFGVVWEWPTTPEGIEVTRQLRLINKHLAHLTWERTKKLTPDLDVGIGWKPLVTIMALLPIVESFVSLLRFQYPDYADSMRASIETIFRQREFDV